MLTAYGIFWAAEGAGVGWPGGDAMLVVLVLAVLGASLVAAHLLRRSARLPAGS
jgi:uncharacterized membrane protein